MQSSQLIEERYRYHSYLLRPVFLLQVFIIMSSTWQSVPVQHLQVDFFTTFQYQFSRVLGKGGFGEVVLAKSLKKGRPDQAVKTAPRWTETGGTKKMRYLLHEAELLFNLKHPRLVKMYCAAVCPQFAYMVMDVYPKGDLDDNMLQLKDMSQVCRAMVDISRAVHYLHRNRIVHLDIKPTNILIDSSDNAVLADLGIAKRMLPGEDTVCFGFGHRTVRAPEMNIEPLEPFCPFKVSGK